jgi:hypothetical protein
MDPVDEEVVTPADDVRGDVASALASLKGDEPALEPAPVEATEPPAQADPRPRNERGQFMKADGSVDPDQTPKTVPDADPSKVNEPQPSTAAVAPAGWSAEAKAEFGKLPPAVQAAVVKRESEINEGGARWSEEKKALVSHFEPVREAAQRYGVHPGEVIKRLAKANDFIESNPVEGIKWLANAYGVDLSKPLTADAPALRPQADPMVSQLSEKVSSLESFIQTQQAEQVNGSLTAFAAAPGHEHFEAVRVDMGKLMLAGLASNLQDAYDKAVWASPDIRSKVMASQNATAEAARKAKETADKARRGAISVNGSPGAPLAPARVQNAGNSVEDDVRAAMEQLRH